MNANPAPSRAHEVHQPSVQDSQPGDIDIGVVGDVMLVGGVWTRDAAEHAAALRGTCWSAFRDVPLILANLEAPISEESHPVERKPYNYRTGAWVTTIFDERFVLSLANNHVMDYGPRGLADTLDTLDRAGIAHAGAGMTLDLASRPHYRAVRGIETGVICAADPRFGAASAATAGTFPARPGLLGEAVAEARRRAALVAVTIHMGLEHTSTPSGRQVALAEECLRSGARLVVFHHAHRAGGHTLRDRGLVLWATGNYVFPPSPRADPVKGSRTATWRVRYSAARDAVTALTIDPAVIDPGGVPQPLAGHGIERERARLHRYGARIDPRLRRRVWRGVEMLSPGFLRFNLSNYLDLLRLRGPWFVSRTLVAGLRAQLLRGK